MKILRNIALVSALLIFGIGILGASVWQTSAQSTSQNYKLTPVVNQENNSVQGQATEKVKEEDYFLAYPTPPTFPGILPGHPLYPLKMIRDKILLFLTTDSLKKAELLLQFADKRIRAAEALILEKNKVDLGISTLTKAEKYLEQAINQEKIASEAGKDTKDFLKRLSRATKKHEEMMLGFEEKIPTTAKPVYDSALQYARLGHQRVMERIGQ